MGLLYMFVTLPQTHVIIALFNYMSSLYNANDDFKSLHFDSGHRPASLNQTQPVFVILYIPVLYSITQGERGGGRGRGRGREGEGEGEGEAEGEGEGEGEAEGEGEGEGERDFRHQIEDNECLLTTEMLMCLN